ncbi:MAG: DUF975 family protein [Minisyncoccia bacterium]
MKTENKVLMAQAREILKDKWSKSIGIVFLSMAIVMAANFIPVIGWLLTYFISGAFLYGTAVYFLNLSRGKEVSIEQLFDGFNHYGRTLGAYLLQMLFIFLWTLLFIIPGIIAAYSYALVFYILVDEPNLKPLEALRKSKKMMDGNKAKLFYLGLRFLGWVLLCIPTFGIGFIWLAPYMQATLVKFYEDTKKNFESSVSTNTENVNINNTETVHAETNIETPTEVTQPTI